MNPWDRNIVRDWYLRFHESVERFNDGAMWTLIAYENSFHAQPGEYNGEIYTRVFQRCPADSTEHKCVWAGSHLPRDLLDRRISPKRPNVKWGQPGSTVRLCDLDSQRSKAEHIHVEANVTFSTEFTLHLRPGKINVRLGTSGGRNMVKLSLNPRHVVYSDTQTH